MNGATCDRVKAAETAFISALQVALFDLGELEAALAMDRAFPRVLDEKSPVLFILPPALPV